MTNILSAFGMFTKKVTKPMVLYIQIECVIW